MTAQLSLSVTRHGRTTVVGLAGEIDIATADLVAGMLKELIRMGHTTLALDASGVRFCDSTGLEALLQTHDEAWKAGGGLRLIGVHGALGRVLDLTGCRQVFEMDDMALAG
ncbi:STAS domain-containing protein [Sphaerisporangium sp. NPDC088356]|uniref:STAS domain-containing protein n=1 Tax=Sphaerisporangium sp. NPDC088356 TaxID=3154871 RepID=UPI0034428376